MDTGALRSWFASVVLPMEPRLLSYFGRRWKDQTEVRDMLHDVYEKALAGAREQIPDNGEAYVFAIARNLLISRVRRSKIVSFDLVADFETIAQDHEWRTPERHASAREELQRAIEGMEKLPPRCREMVRLRKVEGPSIREVAERLGVSAAAVERQLTLGMCALSDYMLGGSGRVKREKPNGILRIIAGGRRDA